MQGPLGPHPADLLQGNLCRLQAAPLRQEGARSTHSSCDQPTRATDAAQLLDCGQNVHESNLR